MGVSRVGGIVCAIVVLSAARVSAQSKRPMTFEDLMRVERISDPQVSPDGNWVSYTQTTVDLAANTKTNHVWLVPLQGGPARQLAPEEAERARWSPDGRSIAFISDRGDDPQIWVMPATGGTARQVTALATGADGVTWARHADVLLFTSTVYPACTSAVDVAACNKQKLDSANANPAKAQISTELLFRHWTVWRSGRYTHLFVVATDGSNLKDLTPGAVDSPTFFVGGADGYDIAPDGMEAVVTSNRTGHPAWTTNNDLYLTPTVAAASQPRDITAANPGSDAAPQFSPDGRYIAYTSQARDGYEADLFRLRVFDRQTGSSQDLTTGFNNWVEAFTWAPDSHTLYFLAPEGVETPVYRVSLSAPHGTRPEKIIGGTNSEIVVAPDGQSLVVTRSSVTQPSEVYRVALGTRAIAPLTHANDALLAGLDLPVPEVVSTRGALGARVESLLLKPPGFTPGQKYPGLVLIHGGPQSAWTDSWGYRWNPELFAARGYVVIMPNPHGSVGYGQPFTEEISGDWGGAPYRDVMAATDQLEALPYVDSARVGAAGASYGGYMIDWIAGQTHRFKTLVSHDGTYDLRSMYATEELWFMDWEFKGTPWGNPALYEKWSPSRYVQNIATPMLIIEGAKDYRVPEGQALLLYTSLQRRGIPSKLLYTEKEGHWVLAPRDSQLWYATVQDWLDHYLK
jgi:dipeptidyl aminopeptidase/acylaminoacyl peptidase